MSHAPSRNRNVLLLSSLLVAGALAVCVAPARAGDVQYSVGANLAPGVSIGVTNVPPPRPVYVAPAPVYVQPAPVVVAPAPVVVSPAPVYVQPAPEVRYVESRWRKRREHERRERERWEHEHEHEHHDHGRGHGHGHDHDD